MASNGFAERAVQIVKKGLKKRSSGAMSSRLAVATVYSNYENAIIKKLENLAR